MNLTRLKRDIEHLAVLLEIRGEREERKREEELRLRLLAVLALVLANEDYNAFRYAFLNELRLAMEALDVNGEYGDLIDREIAEQGGYLSGFIQDLKNGELSEAQAQARAKQYASSVGGFSNALVVARQGEAMLAWYVDKDAENCPDCLELEGEQHRASVWLNYHIPRDGRTQCRGNCKCSLEPV